MSKSIPLAEIQEGMVTDRDVTNPQGTILLRKGVALTDKHINIFKTWGIKEVVIKDDVADDSLNGKPPQVLAEEDIARTETALDAKFRDFAEHELMQTIKRVAFECRVAQIKQRYEV